MAWHDCAAAATLTAMTGPFADRLFRIAFCLAGIYNLAFGLWAALWPHAFFELFDLQSPRYPGIWACLGMVVAVYGLLAFLFIRPWPLPVLERIRLGMAARVHFPR